MKRTMAVELVRGVDVAEEMQAAIFGDLRLSKRCSTIVGALTRNPGASLPQMMADDAELMGAYQFFKNEKVTPQGILAPHAAATAQRSKTAKEVLVIHDTTEVKFTGEHREELGSLSSKGEGFFAHASLVVVQSLGIGVPLGVAALQLHTRPPGRQKQARRLPLMDEGNERRRWALGVDESAAVLGEEVAQIHVMDRESDHYELLSYLRECKRRFVVRLSYDRILFSDDATEDQHISQALATVEGVCHRTVHIGPRKAKNMPDANKKHPPREERDAILSFASTRVRIKRPHGLRAELPSFLEESLVRVWEANPPPGEEPIEWILATTEPIQTPADILRVVDIYRHRWLIEEFFKALKSGCAVQKRGLLLATALENIFTLSIPVAWQMLQLRALSRLQDQPSATVVLTSLQLALLVAATSKLPPRQRCPASSTVRQALLSIAALGGHLTRNGDPGWHSLAHGCERLRAFEEGYRLAMMIGPVDEN
jgi:hypothetical protein